MAGISRRCKRRPNSGIGGCTGNGSGTPPTVYPGKPPYVVPRPPGPPAPPPRSPPAPRVRPNGTTIDIPVNIPLRPFTGPAPIKVGITRVSANSTPEFVDGQMVFGLPTTATDANATLTPSDANYNDENLVVTIDGSVSPIGSSDLVAIDIIGDQLQSAVDDSYVPAMSFDDTVILNESTQTSPGGGGPVV
jgi:hypothetical protein